jgi:hypothetical protein
MIGFNILPKSFGIAGTASVHGTEASFVDFAQLGLVADR